MTRLHTRVARHGRSTVLIVPPEEARKARLRPGQRIVVEPVTEPDEPWAGSLRKYGIPRKEWDALERGLWE